MTRAEEGKGARFLDAVCLAAAVFFNGGASASASSSSSSLMLLLLRDDGAIPPLLGRALSPTGFLNSDLRGPADLARADTGREGAVGVGCWEVRSGKGA